MNQLITHARIVTEHDVIEDGFVYIAQGFIKDIGTREQLASVIDKLQANKQADQLNVAIIDAQGQWLLPGFIDVHVHGGYGADFMDAHAHGLDTITSFHARHGTTAMLATTVTAPRDALEHVLQAVSA